MTNFSATTWQVEPCRGPRPFKPGDIVMDSWEIVRLLGEGGYGSVYEIRKNIYGVNSVSALKVMPIPKERNYISALLSMGSTKQQVDEEIRSQVNRSVAEVQTMKRLIDHPAVVRCEDFSVVQYEDDESWDIFIRMELLTPLPDWMNHHPITPEKVREIGVTLADLLQYCGENKILHRDIKPGNLFMNSMNHIKLGDFGLARTLSAGSSTHSHGVGTDAFMAPEVAANQHYDNHADIFSLGLVLYWLLNNRRLPFMGDGVSFSQAISLRITGRPLPPIDGVDKMLMDAILCACAFKPENRFRTAAAMKQALLCVSDHIVHPQTHPVAKPAPVPVHPVEKPIAPKDPTPVKKQTECSSSSDPWANAERRYAPGTVVTGTVIEISGIGAIVKLEPGVEGSVHISECANRRIAHVEEVVHVGDTVCVKVLRVDAGKKRITLSIRQAENAAVSMPQPQNLSDLQIDRNPWTNPRYAVGQIVEGVVLETFGNGVNVQVEPGMESFVLEAECPDDRVLDVGDIVDVKILYIKPASKRLILSIRQAKESTSAPARASFMPAKKDESPWWGASKNDLPDGFLLSPPYVKPPEHSNRNDYKSKDVIYLDAVSIKDHGSFELISNDKVPPQYSILLVPKCLRISRVRNAGYDSVMHTTALMFDSIRAVWFEIHGNFLNKYATAMIEFKEPNTSPIWIRDTLVGGLNALAIRLAEYAHIQLQQGSGPWTEAPDGKYNVEFSGYYRERFLDTIKALRTWDPHMDLTTAHNLLKRVPVAIHRSVTYQEARQTVELLNQGGAVCRVTKL